MHRGKLTVGKSTLNSNKAAVFTVSTFRYMVYAWGFKENFVTNEDYVLESVTTSYLLNSSNVWDWNMSILYANSVEEISANQMAVNPGLFI